MYLLNNTPIFLEFFKRFCKLGDFEFKNRKIHNKLFIYSKCNCGQKDCATITLKSKVPFKEKIQGSYTVGTTKGYFVFHILENGFLKFEALSYEKFPYKKEIDKYLLRQKKIDDILPIKRKKVKKLSKIDKQLLHKYFKDLTLEKPNIVYLDDIDLEIRNDK